MMLIQVNTDGNVLGQEKLLKQVRAVVTNALTHLRGEVDRVEIHLSDASGYRQFQLEMRCRMEACLQGQAPIRVEHGAGQLGAAIDGAASKLKHSLERALVSPLC